ncbi:MAG: sarcosine oxidase subunit gamma [Pelagimonas sp.]|uniref:sarcosine oxidase subunit gamma n=1 Tax=Pelagimonas sp. TaxID=2073170 RepID=UPI003D6A3413
MSDLIPITALGATSPRTVTHGSIVLTEKSDLGLASLAMCHNGAQPVPFGMALPDTGGLVGGQGFSAFWTGAEQWMVCAQGRAEDDFAAEVLAQAPGHAVTEQTDAWVAFEISAPKGNLERLLERLVNAHPKTIAPGMALRTGLEHQSVFVLRASADCVTILGMRSAALSLWHALDTAAARLAAGDQT